MVFNGTFKIISVISCRLVLLVEETTVPWENHWPAASHWPNCSHGFISSTPGDELTTLVVIDTDCTGSCKSNYHTITTTAPIIAIHNMVNIRNNDIQNITQKTKDRALRTSQKSGGELRYSEKVISSCYFYRWNKKQQNIVQAGKRKFYINIFAQCFLSLLMCTESSRNADKMIR